MIRWMLRYSVALCLVGVASAGMRAGSSDGPSRDERSASPTTTTTAPTTTTTTAPPLFGPPPTVEGVTAVRTGTGLVLPVMAAMPEGWQVLTPCSNAAVLEATPVTGAHVVIDPGHGGSEPGAVGPTGLLEKDLNLDVALRLRDLLEAQGAVVELTRTTDIRVTLETRAAIATALKPLAFVSIHHNAAPLAVGDQPASELYHQLNDPESKRLAGLMWEELWTAFAPHGTSWAKGDGPGARARQSVRTGDDFYGVLRRTQGVPAVLTEAAYLSNPPEEALLKTEEFRQVEAQAMADAIVRLVATDDPGSGFVATKVADAPAGGGGGSVGCEDPPLS